MAIWFDIDPNSGAPIFKQIIDQVKRAIASGMLKPDEQLPTVRELAEEHSINPNTIAKAYQNLEAMKLVYTRPGVRGGTFIAKNVKTGVLEDEMLERFEEDLRKLVRDGYNLGLDAEDLKRRLLREVDQWYIAHPLPAPARIDLTPVQSERGAQKLYSSKE